MTDDELIKRIKQEHQKLLDWVATLEFPEEDEDDSEGATLEQTLEGLLWEVSALRVRVEALEAERKG
jgi:tRNA U34 5-carboxymethylaminomethyl modifying GTPase MnmE/TrmE